MVDRLIKDLTLRPFAAGDAIETDDGSTSGGNRAELSATAAALLNATTAAEARAAFKCVNPAEGWFYREEFVNGASGLSLMSTSNAGGSNNTTINPNPGENVIGMLNLTTGSAASAAQRGGFASNLTMMYPGGQNDIWYCGIRMKANNRPDGTALGHFFGGFADVVSSLGNGGVGFVLRDAIANWEFITRNGGVETAVDTLVAGTNGQDVQDFAFVLAASAGWVQPYVNGAALGSPITTNINTTGNRAGFKAIALRDAAVATNLSMFLDTFEVGCLYGTRRGAFDFIR